MIEVNLHTSVTEALAIADALELLAAIDEGENTDHDELLRLAALVRHVCEPAPATREP